MYSISGNYINKNKIIEPMVPGMVAIDKDAIAAESDRRGTSTKSGTSYSEKTGGITQTKEVEQEINIEEKSKSFSESIDIVDKEVITEVTEEQKTERKATLEESVFKSKSTKTINENLNDVVIMCEHCDRQKCTVKLGYGDYPDLSNEGVDINGPNGISSLIVPKDFSITVFSGKNYTGKSWTINGPNAISCLVHFGWNDMIASCKVGRTASKARFSLHCSFGGWNKEYGPGEYPSVNKLGMTGGISSIKMGSDLKMTVYRGENFSGASKEYNGPITINCLVSHGWNDRINSFKLFSKSDFKKINESSSKWTQYYNKSPTKIIRRECQDCRGEYQTIFYKRLTPISKLNRNKQDLRDLFLNNWFSDGNKINQDFELYSTYAAAAGLKNDENKQAIIEFPPTETYQFVHAIMLQGVEKGVESEGLNYEEIPISDLNGQLVWGDRNYKFSNTPSDINGKSNKILLKPSRHKAINRGTKIKLILENGKVGDTIYVFIASGRDSGRNGGWDKSLVSKGFTKITSDKPRWDLEVFATYKYNIRESDMKTISSTQDNRWVFCNYDDPTVGFPRDCGIKGSVPYQWNAINRNSAVRKFRYSMEYEKNKWVTLYQTPDFSPLKGDTNLTVKDLENPDSSSSKSGPSIFVYANPKEYSFSNTNMTASSLESLKLPREFTVMAWVYQNRRSPDWVRVIGKGWWHNRNYGLWIHPNGTSLAQTYGPRYTTHHHNGVWPGPVINLGEWTHMAMTFRSGGYMEMFINGKSAGKNNNTGLARTDNEPLTLGGAGFHTKLYGQVKNAAVFNIQLSAEQIALFAADHTKDVTKIVRDDGSTYTEESSKKITDLSALPVPGETLWHYVKDRKPDENKYLWSGRIYNCMKGNQGCGTEFSDEGGSRHNAIWFIPSPGSLPSSCIRSTPNSYNYQQIGGDLSGLKHILLEVNTTNDAHIALGENASHNSTHYEIVLGGWANSSSVIRPSNQGPNLVTYDDVIFGEDLVPGLKYEYYNVTRSNGTFEPNPFKTEIRHEELNYWWASGRVLNSGKSDYVGLKIKGFIKMPESGNYKFRIRTDDGFRLKISDKYIINTWRPQAPTWHQSGNVNFEAGKTYDFFTEWYEWGGYAVMQIYWMRPSSNSWELIPKSAFYQFAQKPEKFWISWDENNLKVGKGHDINDKQLMQADISGYKYKINTVMVSTGWGATGVWKLYSGSCDTSKLSKETADKLCNNPCYWYGQRGSGNARQSFIDANMCDCSKGNDPFGCNERSGKCAKAINWDVEPTTIPAFKQSNTNSITSTKEYKEKIKSESKSETNLTQSSSSLTEVVQLDPNVSIIPGKSKPDPNMQAYFTEDELSKKKEIAGKKLNLRGGPKRVDNIVTKINDSDIEKTEDTKTEEEPKPTSVSKPLPPPPPKRPTGRGRTLPTKKEPAPAPATTQEGSGMQSYILLLIIIFIIMYFYMKKN